jgi:hypothetical protein
LDDYLPFLLPAENFFHDDMPKSWSVTIAVLCFLGNYWTYRVLTREDVRALF